MHRFFALPMEGGLYRIHGQEAAHLQKVLRLHPGDEVELLDGLGGRFLARLESVEKDLSTASVLEALPSNEAQVRVTLYQGIPKADKLDFLVQKATELGLHAVQPVLMARCDVKLSAERADKRADRLSRIAQEAAKQCGRARPVQVLPPQRLQDLSEVLRAHSCILVPYEEGGAPFLGTAGEADLSDCAYLIGPEGGIEPGEIGFLRELGARVVTLGPRILRTETAALSVGAALMAQAGQWA